MPCSPATLAVLDDMDGDPDLEEGDDLEPSLTSTTNKNFGDGDDRELCGSETELEMGGVGDKTDQRRWGAEAGQEGDGEPDKEPSLGSIATTDQRYWSGGPTGKARHLDREQACEDEGAQCDDEGAPGYEGVPSYGMDQTTPLGWSIVR